MHIQHVQLQHLYPRSKLQSQSRVEYTWCQLHKSRKFSRCTASQWRGHFTLANFMLLTITQKVSLHKRCTYPSPFHSRLGSSSLSRLPLPEASLSWLLHGEPLSAMPFPLVEPPFSACDDRLTYKVVVGIKRQIQIQHTMRIGQHNIRLVL